VSYCGQWRLFGVELGPEAMAALPGTANMDGGGQIDRILQLKIDLTQTGRLLTNPNRAKSP
jgi:hypothetical protein